MAADFPSNTHISRRSNVHHRRHRKYRQRCPQ